MEFKNLETLPNEIWREHPIGVFVSNLGRVFVPQSGTHKEHYTYGCTDKKDYKVIGWKNKQYSVHILVAECFIPNDNNYPTVDHINRNKSDNRIENLRWATLSMQQYNRGKYIKPNTPKNNACSKQVAQIDPTTNEVVRIWESMQECSRNGFCSSHICYCCLGKRYTHKGYKWQYA